MLVAVSLGVMNALSYLFTVLAARRMGPEAFGAFASLMGLIVVINVVAMGLQAAAARRLATPGGDRRTVVRAVNRVGWWCAIGTFALLLALSPLLHDLLSLDSWFSAALLAVCGGPLAIFGVQVGLLQGHERWGGYAIVYLVFGVTRLGLGWLGIVIHPDPLGAMAGVTLGVVITVIAGGLVTRALGREGREGPPPPRRLERGVLRESLLASTALFAFYALSSADVLLARIVLPAYDTGLYAGGQILAKAVLFLPFFVSVVAYPALARGHRTHLHLWGLGLVLLMGGVVAAFAAIAPGVALIFVGGSAYAPVTELLWAFALIGTLLAGIQLLVMTALARRSMRSAWVVWLALAALAVAALGMHSWPHLLWLVLGVDAAVLGILVVLTWPRRSPISEPPRAMSDPRPH